MFGSSINQLTSFLFLFVVPIIVGLIIIFSPRLIREFFLFLFAFFKFLFHLIFKKSSDHEIDLLGASKVKTDVIPAIPKITVEPLVIRHIYELSPKYFEVFTGIILGRMGFYNIKVTGKSSDHGVDLEAYKTGRLCLAQCKRYVYGQKGGNKVTAKEIRELHSNIVQRNAVGYFITTGKFTPNAVNQANEFKGEQTIKLIDGEQLIEICKQNNIKTNKQLLEEILKTFS